MDELEKAKSALRQAAQHGLVHAAGEYVSFLHALHEWEAQLGLAGITFDLPAGAEPEILDFQTLIGPIRAVRSLVMHDDRLAFALTFTDPAEAGHASPQSPLWWVKLSWATPWIDAKGSEFTRDFATDTTKSHQVLDLLQCAVAEKLLRHTRALVPI